MWSLFNTMSGQEALGSGSHHRHMVICMQSWAQFPEQPVVVSCLQRDQQPLLYYHATDPLRGGARVRAPQDMLRISCVNTTSFMVHCRSIAEVASDFVHVTETRISPAVQKILTQALKHRGWNTIWCPICWGLLCQRRSCPTVCCAAWHGPLLCPASRPSVVVVPHPCLVC